MVALLLSAGATPGANEANAEPLEHLELPRTLSPYNIKLQSAP
jgi:hypothetical protein